MNLQTERKQLDAQAEFELTVLDPSAPPARVVIDCPVDYSENDRILNSELRERALAI